MAEAAVLAGRAASVVARRTAGAVGAIRISSFIDRIVASLNPSAMVEAQRGIVAVFTDQAARGRGRGRLLP